MKAVKIEAMEAQTLLNTSDSNRQVATQREANCPDSKGALAEGGLECDTTRQETPILEDTGQTTEERHIAAPSLPWKEGFMATTSERGPLCIPTACQKQPVRSHPLLS
jgi:hypothetical protein